MINGTINGTIKGTTNDTITDIEGDILSWLKENLSLTVNDLVKKSGKSSRMISRYLSSLKRKGLLKREGFNKAGYWKVV